MTKALRDELKEIDYLNRLSPEEREYYLQFLFEYYQADFSFETPIHPPDKIKECRDRNNASKRQLHSVGSKIISMSATKAREAQWSARGSTKYYTPEDYIKPDISDDEGE